MVNEQLTKEEKRRFRMVNIHDIIGIAHTGRRIDMQCPLRDHNDKTPSFSLYPDNSYHCFGCKKHGSGAIDFMRDYTGKVKFLDIIEELLPYV